MQYKGKHPRRNKRKNRIHWIFPKKKPKTDGSYSNDVSIRATCTRWRVDKVSSTQFFHAFRFSRQQSRSPGGNVPGYKDKIKRHISATSPFQATKFSYASKSYFGKGRYANPTEPPPKPNSFVGTLYGNGDGASLSSNVPTTPPVFSGTAYTSAYNQAVQKLYDTIRGLESSVTGTGEDLGDYHQTINLFKRGLGGLQDLIGYVARNHENILKKGVQWNNAKRTVKSLGSLVTEYRYGIEPLAKDLGEGAAALQTSRYLDAFVPFSVKGKATSFVEKTDTTYESFPSVHVRGITATEQMVRFKGEYHVRGDGGSDYARSVGLTWREFIPTIYNLIPYSFLLDYVTNLHTFVEAVAVPWAGVAWCVKTERSKETYTALYDFRSADQNSLFTLQQQTPGYFKATATGVRRSETLSIPFPILEWQKPSRRQLENTLALVASKLPVLGSLTKRLLRSPSGKTLDNEFRLAVRHTIPKVPYPFHRAP